MLKNVVTLKSGQSSLRVIESGAIRRIQVLALRLLRVVFVLNVVSR